VRTIDREREWVGGEKETWVSVPRKTSLIKEGYKKGKIKETPPPGWDERGPSTISDLQGVKKGLFDNCRSWLGGVIRGKCTPENESKKEMLVADDRVVGKKKENRHLLRGQHVDRPSGVVSWS